MYEALFCELAGVLDASPQWQVLSAVALFTSERTMPTEAVTSTGKGRE